MANEREAGTLILNQLKTFNDSVISDIPQLI